MTTRGNDQEVGKLGSLQPEIWSRILYFVRRDVPPAMSKPARMDIRQGDLVSAMQVCTMFYELVLPLLYTTVITDDLNALLSAHSRTKCSGRLAGKAAHLQRIKHLCIEHTDKTTIASDDHDQVTSAHEIELSSLHRAITSPVFSALNGPFPNLETLSLGAVYGASDPAAWTAFCRTKLDPGRGRLIREVSDAMSRLLSSPKLRHICQRGGGGLLHFPALIENPPPVLSAAMMTTHIAPGEEYWPIPLGKPCRWIMDGSHPFSTILQSIESVLSLSSSMRPWTSEAKDQRFLLDIYASGTESPTDFNRRENEDLPPGWRWEGMTASYWSCLEGKDLEGVVKGIIGRMVGFGAGKDEIRWFPRNKAERCGACGAR